LIDDAGLRIDNQLSTADLSAIPAEWQDSVKTVDDDAQATRERSHLTPTVPTQPSAMPAHHPRSNGECLCAAPQ